MGFVDPLIAIIVSLCFLGGMIYKRVNLGISLNLTAFLLAFLSIKWSRVPSIILATSVDARTMSVVSATFGIMVMSQLYKETGVIRDLSRSLAEILDNPKLVVSALPAIIGLLPVAGGALMSAPLMETNAERLGLKADKKTYVNVWFRHTIFPVYPISQVLILTAALAGLVATRILVRQIPVVVTMIIIGYLIGLRKANPTADIVVESKSVGSQLKRLIVTFLPILATIATVIGFGFDVSVAALVGVVVLVLISKPTFETFCNPFMNPSTYGISLAAYGAFLLRSVVDAMGLSQVFGAFLGSGSVNPVFLLTVIPAVLGFFVGSPLGAVAISFSILDGTLTFSPESAALLYMSSYLGYVIAPTHLCLVLTADYFQCPLGKLYKYFIPSLVFTFGTAILLYLFV